jgi:hypothetical protein
MAKNMDDRLKMGPLKPQWEGIKGRTPLLKNNGINTSALSQLLQKYDTHITRYKTLDADWWKLDKALPPLLKSAIDIGTKIEDLDGQLEKLMTKDKAVIQPAFDKVEKLAADANADPNEILAALDDIAAAGNDLVVGRSGLWGQMDKLAHQKAQMMTKSRDEYRKNISAITKEIDGMVKDCDTLEANMRTNVSKYQVEARRLDHQDVADNMDAFVAVLAGP